MESASRRRWPIRSPRNWGAATPVAPRAAPKNESERDELVARVARINAEIAGIPADEIGVSITDPLELARLATDYRIPADKLPLNALLIRECNEAEAGNVTDRDDGSYIPPHVTGSSRGKVVRQRVSVARPEDGETVFVETPLAPVEYRALLRVSHHWHVPPVVLARAAILRLLGDQREPRG